MCGFIYSNFGNVEKFKNISSSMAHRGPDSSKFYYHKKYNHQLYFYRLSINDISSKGDQPFIDVDLITVSNCEIYNFKEIRSELLSLGAKFKSNSDAEVIHQGYKFFGLDIFKKIQGMYAILIIDLKNEKLVFCRDHIGIKPLYFYHDKNKFSLSSEFLTLNKLIHSNNLSNLDNNYLKNFIYKPFNCSSKTIQKNLVKVEPGYAYSFNFKNQNIIKFKFWEMTANPNISNLSLSEKYEYFDELFKNTIKKHLVSDVKVGSMLSGGIDSSLITALASKYTNNLNTYTIDIDNSLTNEDINSINDIKKLGISNFYFNISYKKIMDNIDDSIKIFDDLSSSDPGFISNYFLLKEIKKVDPDLKVILMGDGADEVFFGYNWFRFLNNKFLPNILKNYLHYYAYNRLVNMKSFFSKEYPSYNRHLNGMRNFEILKQLPNHYLPKVDRSTMYNSLEGRVPFLDQNIIEFACSLKENELFKNNNTKYFIRKYSENYLPKNISYKEKKGFGLNVKTLMNKDIDKLSDIILANNSFSNSIFSKKFKEKLIKNNQMKAHQSIFSLSKEVTLWRIFLADLWYNQITNV